MSELRSTGLLDLGPKQEHIVVSNEEQDDIVLQEVELSRSTLLNLGLKRARFSSCRISHCVVEDCYLKDAVFTNVCFVGTRFINCNLERAEFNSCDLKYASFSGCRLNLREILANLPIEPNLTVELLKELRRNEQGLLNPRDADRILLRQLRYERSLYRDRLAARTGYFRRTTTTSDRVKAGRKYVGSLFEEICWGYGLMVGRLLAIGVLAIALFAVLLFFGGVTFRNPSGAEQQLSFLQCLYVSASSFTTLGLSGHSPLSVLGKVVIGIEGLLGMIFIGLLGATFYRRIAR